MGLSITTEEGQKIIGLFTEIKTRLDRLEDRLDRLESKVDALTGDVEILTTKVDALTVDVETLKNNLLAPQERRRQA